MTEEQKQALVNKVMLMIPTASEDRLKSLLAIILLEIESYNDCGNEIDWGKLSDLVLEVLFQSLKNESEQTITSVKRGDTSISYANKSQEISKLLTNYSDLIKRLIGCNTSGVIFW